MKPLSASDSLFKGALAAATVGSIGATSIRAAESQKKRAIKKAFRLNSFPNAKLSLSEKFKLIKAAGFHGVEPNSHMDRQEILEAMKATGLEVASVSCGEHTRMLSEPAASRRKQGLEGLIYSLERAKEYGATSILVVAGGVNANTSYADTWKRTQEEIGKAVPVAEKLGVTISIENVWNHFLLSPLEAARYVDEFKSAAVGFHFDIGNVMSIGWPEHWIQILGKRIQRIHVKEFSRKKMDERGVPKGFSVEYLEGDNDWPSVMKALDEIGYTGWAIVEPACGECKQNITPAEYLQKVSGQLDKILAA